ncbi:molybdopterin-guanine dinucleotide biosynthesis protein B [Neobacillus cucumis]|uniref:molybdopterin-guanine dinucleotide biosynthesis protein B n=1 Tax=Neobacillus cucumis TaxID=1740721 RepID=UPI002E1D346D|nr:molybdopterin-guanine dinucleotide biosynthesis protein B [Neobacillus cucumis]MED4225152.1 molybdopterin-guanine dinucleotide biosynthesis protein B [Neobacillus cucumis]
MALVKPFIFQVVGYQNSGKTTTIIKLIQTLTEQGLKPVTIKHHGHGGKPAVMEEKDSSLYLRSGAIASIVEGAGRMILQVDNLNVSLEKQLDLLKYFQADVILVEGYKQENFPKLLLLRDLDDLPLLTTLNNIQAVAVWKEDLFPLMVEDYPFFSIHDTEVINWTANFIKDHVHKNDEKS